MAADYPTSVKSFATKVDNVDLVMAADINDIQTEVTAIETQLVTSKLATLTTAPAASKVLTTDGSGNPTWAAKAPDSDLLDGINGASFALKADLTITGFSLADDTAMTVLAPNIARGLFFLFSYGTTHSIIVGTVCNSVGSSYCRQIANLYPTACRTQTGALTGTTGTDAYITVSPHTDGYIYIENRLGATFYGAYLAL